MFKSMKTKHIHIGDSLLKHTQKAIEGKYVTIQNEIFYKISNYDHMQPFFMSIVSNSDHWMFISSNGALTAGRKNPDSALFPYYTDDKIQDYTNITGSKTIIFAEYSGKTFLWEPFSQHYDDLYGTERNCYKNIYGNKLVFEEINFDLQLTFQYAWLSSEKYGFVKKSKVINHNEQSVSVNILDGIQNILPYGIGRQFQLEYSTLADAYKKSELETDIGLAIFSLSSIPVDKAEPSEALKATTVWSTGIIPKKILLSSRQVGAFRKGLTIEQETNIRAFRGAYFLNSLFEIKPGKNRDWYIIAEINQDSMNIIELKQLLKNKQIIIQKLENDIDEGTANLFNLVTKSDGIQESADILTTSRHYSNVLFNIMRGGLFNDDYQIDKHDFLRYLSNSNKYLYKKYHSIVENLPDKLTYSELVEILSKQDDLDLEKLCYEYLPLFFSRRHGDPSRPWNKFSIEIKNEQGKENLNYQGNWRDIFQNWEALAYSFPEYIENMITKFVNASTADGYNPYRVTRDGFDWEVMNPADPWSYIGYWGDHQIVYLLKLLELSHKFHPGKLKTLLKKDIFVYANVPYRIKTYQEILEDPQNTVDFDEELDKQIGIRMEKIGSDGKFIFSKNGKIYHVNLTEKLLIPVLTKLSNFIPEAGIWMNTQRPEWNDANNALVGYGVSMVTLYYLRRHLNFYQDLFKTIKNESFKISNEAAKLFNIIFMILNENKKLLSDHISDLDRKILLDQLGEAGSNYRNTIYKKGFSEKRIELKFDELVKFFDLSIKYIDHSIQANRRGDNLYHAYNLMKVKNNKSVSISYLFEMLEGQVAILSSGFLSPQESIEILKALRNSDLYREDQNSYILYPNRQLPRFLEKNNISTDVFKKSELLKSLISNGDKNIVNQDIDGGIHFNGIFRNAADLKQALENINSEKLQSLVRKEKETILKTFEEMFDHQSFTGRSGTFFKYEGLGSIYWHMVSKLLLVVQENYYRALENQADSGILKKLKKFYYEIKEGIGVHKSPELYGGFPTDPYSHTPAHAGVQQPGMTGQVKEDIISRFGELGIIVKKGKISFHSGLIKMDEFIKRSAIFKFFDVKGKQQQINLQRNSLGFTIAQVPVVYHWSNEEKIVVKMAGNMKKTIKGLTIDEKMGSSIFNRNGEIHQIDVYFKSRN
jgi:hypothetical protein